MRERWKGFGVASVFALLGLGVAIWLVTGRPEPGADARLLLAVLFGGFAAWCFCGNSRFGQVRSFGLGLGMLFAMSGSVWVYMVESWVWGGLVRLRGGAWERFWESWETVCVNLLPAAGVFVAVNILSQAARTTVKRIAGERGRKKSESELFGKAKLLERRWLSRLTEQSGVLLGITGGHIAAYRLEGSSMTFAPPRTGKGATIALNYLDDEGRGWSGSTVLVDPRGETFPVVARRRRCMGRRPILLDPFGVVGRHRELEGQDVFLPAWRSDRYNPLDFIRDGPEAVRDIGVLVDALMERPKTEAGNAKHFYESARSLISGYLAWVRFKVPKERRNLKTLYELLSLGTEDRETLFELVDATPRFAGGLMHLAVERSRRVGKEEGGSNFTTVANQLAFLNYPELAEHTRLSTFDPLDLANGDMDVFVVVPDGLLERVKGWIRLWITIPYAVADRRAMQKDMLIIVDEMPALGYLSAIMEAYNLAAGKGVHFWSFAQSVSALDASWGQDARKTLIHLAEVLQVLGWPRMDVEGAEMLSKAIGAATFESRSESRSGQIRDSSLLPEGQGSVQESLSVVKEQLVPADEILAMGPDEQFVIASPKDMPRDVIRLKHARYWQMRRVKRWADPNPYVVEERVDRERPGQLVVLAVETYVHDPLSVLGGAVGSQG